jgi:hypothetical protein
MQLTQRERKRDTGSESHDQLDHRPVGLRPTTATNDPLHGQPRPRLESITGY